MSAPSQLGGIRRPGPAAQLHLETLEPRCLLAANPWNAGMLVAEQVEDNNTLNHAQALGTLQPLSVTGAIDKTAGGGDVDWYRFDLSGPTNVSLFATTKDGGEAPVLSLYNVDPVNTTDIFNKLGHRRLAQSPDSQDGPSSLTYSLAAGTYYVAVSGADNRDFHPFLAGSGIAGGTGAYELQMSGKALASSAQGPVILASSPRPDEVLTSSPAAIRVSFSAALNSQSLAATLYTMPGPNANQTVRLLFNPTGQFGTTADKLVILRAVGYSATAKELQVFPAEALAPGFYRLVLAGYQTTPTTKVVTSASGAPLGKDADHPKGQDYIVPFQVSGIEGNTELAVADDSPAGAHSLGDLSRTDLLRVTGAIGDDPFYTVPKRNVLPTRGYDVDLYHFRVNGAGHYALTAEAFAGRIGSPLDPALSLFRVDATGRLVFVASNNNTLNDAKTNETFPQVPLYNDAVLNVGLTEGDYYLAVSGNGNVPNPDLGVAPGTNNTFDPNTSHSGKAGNTTGRYVLALQLLPDDKAPTVVDVSLDADSRLAGSPTTFTVQFSEPVNLTQLVSYSYSIDTSKQLASVYVKAEHVAEPYYPLLLSYDATTYQATFLMLQAVPAGKVELHFSSAGKLGLTDLAGNPLVGNAGGTDYVISFEVTGTRGTAGDPLVWQSSGENDTASTPQALGPLFPKELEKGVEFVRASGAESGDTADFYSFSVLQTREYLLKLEGPAGSGFTLRDAFGNLVNGIPQGDGTNAYRFELAPATYVVGVDGWTSEQAADVGYKLSVFLTAAPDNPPPLTIGPAPAIRLRLAEAPAVPPETLPTDPLPGGETTGPGLAGHINFPLATDERSVAVLLTRATDPVGGRSEEGGGAQSTPERLIVRGDELTSPENSRILLAGSSGGAELNTPPVEEKVTKAVEPSTAAAGAATAESESSPNITPQIAEAGTESSGRGLPSTGPLDALFALSPRLTRLAAIGAALPSPSEDGKTSPEEAPSSLGLWVDLLTTASAAGALSLTSWCVAHHWVRRRSKKAGYLVMDWLHEDSTHWDE